MNVLELAKQSFGLIVPQDLVNVSPFNLLDLGEDTLVRVQSVDDTGWISLEDSSSTIVAVTERELNSHEDRLRMQWVSLVPTELIKSVKLKPEFQFK